MTTAPETTVSCVVCGTDKEVQHSLRLTKDKGTWKSNPVCADCKGKLSKAARSEGRFVPFFSLETSNQEAEKRNKESLTFSPFLEKFGRARQESKVKPFTKAETRNLRVAKS